MKNYRKRTNLSRIKLTKNDLQELIDLLQTDTASDMVKEKFKINAELSNLSISEYDIETFFTHKELPNILHNMDIDVYKYSNDLDLDRSINLRLGSYPNTLSISGSDQTWVFGKYTSITNYLKTKRPCLWFLNLPIASILVGIITAFVSLIFYIIFELVSKNGWGSINILSVISIFPLFIIIYGLNKMKSAIIIIRDSNSFIEKNGMLISIIISLLALIATVVIGVIEIHR